MSSLKLIVECARLRAVVSACVSTIERRQTIPILSNLKIVATRPKGSNGEIRMTGTDMDVAIVATCPADVAQEGETTVPAHLLKDIALNAAEGSQISIEDTGSQIRVRAGRSNYALGALPAGDFPAIAGGEYGTETEMAAADLLALMTVPAPSISTEETRYYLNGIYLHPHNDGGVKLLRAVATDGHRLTRFQMPLPSGAENGAGIIVPRKTVMLLQALLREYGDGAVAFAWSDTRLRARVGDIELTSKLVDGAFPDYERVIPQAEGRALEMNVEEATAALKRVALVASDKTRIAKWEIAERRVAFHVGSAEHGMADEEIDASWQGASMMVGVNTNYVQAVLGQMRGENTRWLFLDPVSPIRIVDPADDNVLYVIMPARA